MKTNQKIIFLLGFLFISLSSCNNNPEKKPSNPETLAVNAETNACFERYSTQYDQLLTKADISKAYPIDFSLAEKEYDTAYSSPSYQQMLYSWPSERTRTLEVMGRKMILPVDNKIGMGSIRFFSESEKFPLKLFNTMYHLTDTKKKNAEKSLQKELDKKEKISDSTRKNATKLAGTILSNMKFSPVEGVGDAAVWDYLDSGLIVLTGKTRFTVFVDVGNDHEQEVALSKELAKSILAKCE